MRSFNSASLHTGWHTFDSALFLNLTCKLPFALAKTYIKRKKILLDNQAGFSLTFAKDKETVIDAEFKALPQDIEGTLIKYQEIDNSLGKVKEIKQ